MQKYIIQTVLTLSRNFRSSSKLTKIIITNVKSISRKKRRTRFCSYHLLGLGLGPTLRSVDLAFENAGI